MLHRYMRQYNVYFVPLMFTTLESRRIITMKFLFNIKLYVYIDIDDNSSTVVFF